MGKILSRILKEVRLLPIAPIRYPYELLKLGAKGSRKAYTWNRDRVSDNALEDLMLIGMDFDGNEIAVLEEAILNKEAEIEQTEEKINKHHQDEASLDKKIAEGEAALEKMKNNKNIVGAVTVRAGRKYRVQKDLIENYKRTKKDYPNKIKNERDNLKAKKAQLNEAKNNLKEFKARLRKEAKAHQEVIMVVKYFYKNRDKFVERCHPDVVDSIESEMQEIRDNKGNWPFIATPQEYLQSLKESIKIRRKKAVKKKVLLMPEQRKEPRLEPKAQRATKTKKELDQDWRDFFRNEGNFSAEAFKKATEPKATEPKVTEPEVETTTHYDEDTIGKINAYMGAEILGEEDIASLNDASGYTGTIDEIIAEVKGERRTLTLEEQLAEARRKFEQHKKDENGQTKGGRHLTPEEKSKDAKREAQNTRRREKRAEAKRKKEANVQSLLKNREQLIEAIGKEKTPMIRESFIKELRDIEEILGSYGKKVEPYCENASTIIDKRKEFLEQLKVEDAQNDQKVGESNSERTSEMQKEDPQQDGDGR